MNRFLYIFLFLFMGISLKAQDDVYQFTSTKIRLLDYGQVQQTSTAGTNLIFLNLRDSIITVESQSVSVTDYLGFKNEFSIIGSIGTRKGIQVYVTDDVYVFTFDYARRTIVVARKDVNPRVQALWFEEIEVK